MNILIPSFLIFDLVVWAILIIFFVGFAVYIYKKPSDYINKTKAITIENKKGLGIKIFRLK